VTVSKRKRGSAARSGEKIIRTNVRESGRKGGRIESREEEERGWRRAEAATLDEIYEKSSRRRP
jgi:hypothetical protein